MSIENKNGKEPTPWTPKAKRLGRNAVRGVVALGGAGALIAGAKFGAGLVESNSGPEMHGTRIVVVDKGDTVDEIINVHVEGGASHTGAVRAEVMNDPDNADVFENDQLDIGEELEIPEKVTN